MRKFFYNGHMSSDFGIYISGSGTFNAPERDVEVVSIPGRNGDIVIDNGRFKNITVSYPAFIRTLFKDRSAGARDWLCQSAEYHRLEDSYSPEFYRLARFVGPLDFTTRFLNYSAELELSFDCKPQRYLKDGERVISATGAVTLYNPTSYSALPYIRVYGTSGSLVVGNNIMQLTEIDEYVDLDSETQNAFKGTINCNDKVSNNFPVLAPGEVGITFSGNIIKIEITPRWWTV